jgi:hypothetical protein
MHEARQQVMGFMQSQVRHRKKEIQDQDGVETDNNDVFTILVKANESESGKLKLDDQELVRPCNAFLLRRISDCLADREHFHHVICGTR